MPPLNFRYYTVLSKILLARHPYETDEQYTKSEQNVKHDFTDAKLTGHGDVSFVARSAKEVGLCGLQEIGLGEMSPHWVLGGWENS